MTQNDEVLWVLDMAYHFVVTILLFIYNGVTINICREPLTEQMPLVLKNSPVSTIYATPFHYQIMNHCTELARSDFQKVRLAISTAMRLPSHIGATFYKKYGMHLTQAYGIIEVGLPFINTKYADSRVDSVGEPLAEFSVKIVNANAQGQGKIMLRGPGMFDAYFSPFRLAETILIDGWFDTGDIGVLEDNVLVIVDRAKATINFCGMKIFPALVENVLEKHPMIEQVRIFAVKHPVFGEMPVAELIVSESQKHVDKNETIDDIKAFCYRQLASYCVPKQFKIVQTLPKTKSGKILRQ